MIVDPDIKGCTIWHEGHVCYIKGTVTDCCRSIYSRVTEKIKNDDDTFTIKQIYPIQLDKHGCGIQYADFFYINDIEFTKIHVKNISDILPIRNKLI